MQKVLGRPSAHGLAAISAVVMLSCGGSPQPSPAQAPAQLLVVAGSGQVGAAGTQLSQAAVVRVVDAGGAPVAGQVIAFRVTAGGGSVYAGAAASDAEGTARELWTLGTQAGIQRLEARAVDSRTGAPLLFATFEATAVAGPPASFVAVSGGSQQATPGAVLPQALKVRARDQYGNPIEGLEVAFVITSGTGSADPGAAMTDLSGEASTSWTLGPERGLQQVEARLAGQPPVTFSATGVPVPSNLLVVSGGGQVGTVGLELPLGLAVRVLDHLGQPIPGRAVNFRVSAGGGTVRTGTATSDDTGLAQERWTLGGAAGTQRVEASAVDSLTGVATASASIEATAMAGAPASIVAEDWDPLAPPPHVSMPLTVRVRDDFGNPVSGAPVTFGLDGTASPSTAITDADGRAITAWTPPYCDPGGPRPPTPIFVIECNWMGSVHVTGQAVFAQVGLTTSSLETPPCCSVFNGIYDGIARADPQGGTYPLCGAHVTFTLVDGLLLITPGLFPNSNSIYAPIAADGSFYVESNPGFGNRFAYGGTFSASGPGFGTGTGAVAKYSLGLDADTVCSGTWTAVRR